ncbi:hypothetical protein [Cohnella thermotolerans]|uniref:hypothetical protein n=1 Tax=Cohnella thermotolerans TaxID=329858 RepID=UPI000414F75F|nr:hypothetical protein [Cohnella thermotolerans]
MTVLLDWMEQTFHLVRTHRVKVERKDYLRLTVLVIPPTLLFTLFGLYYWVKWIVPYTGL